MRKYDLFILIAVAIIFCLVTLSNGLPNDVDKSNLVKRSQDSPYRPYGLYQYKHKNKKDYKRRNLKIREIIKKRVPDDVPEPPLGEVSITEEDKAAFFKRKAPAETGHVDTASIFPGKTSNP
ncbi:hypothetical protein C1645_769121 [Glomus cerebriforme]|uniref:Uncharacterized protein n=1 Tax=Glomus cerebriforme TaxID=658196 RepID=A0A397T3T3_9GLOM|nr:hypothetical protein C1645_769121 [Glomus cerebriforme]